MDRYAAIVFSCPRAPCRSPASPLFVSTLHATNNNAVGIGCAAPQAARTTRSRVFWPRWSCRRSRRRRPEGPRPGLRAPSCSLATVTVRRRWMANARACMHACMHAACVCVYRGVVVRGLVPVRSLALENGNTRACVHACMHVNTYVDYLFLVRVCCSSL